MSLTGKTILITRAANQADEFVRLVKDIGGTPIVFPTIVITPPESWDVCDNAIKSLHMYDGLTFTSANGVDGFFKRMKSQGVSVEILKSKMMFAVGDKTKASIEHYGVNVTAVPEKFTAFDLSTMLQQEDLHGKSFLFPRGNLSNNQLSGNLKLLGATVDSVVVYQTKEPDAQSVSEVREMLLNGKIDVATFTSPSTFKNFITLFTPEEIRKINGRVLFAAIGPSTEQTLREAGIESDILPKKSTIEEFVKAIVHHYNSRTTKLEPRTSQ